VLASPDFRVLLSCLCFASWLSALLFGVLGAAAHLFLLASLLLWPWRATFETARGLEPHDVVEKAPGREARRAPDPTEPS
jgi:hypothetical protein